MIGGDEETAEIAFLPISVPKSLEAGVLFYENRNDGLEIRKLEFGFCDAQKVGGKNNRQSSGFVKC